MDFGDNMMLMRKKKKLSQMALGKLIGTSGDVIGRYERGDIKPSIEVVSNIADSLEVSIDYLIGRSTMQLDKEVVKRLEGISNMPDNKKTELFNVIDAYLRDYKTKQEYA